MDKVFFRYIARHFWGPYFLGLGVFVALMLFGSLFDKLNFFMKSEHGFSVYAEYLLCQLPFFAAKMMPMATLLAVLFALGGLIARGEWKAGMAGGWRPIDMAAPLLLCSALAAGLHFAVQEFAAPQLYMRSEYLFEGKLRGRGDWRRLFRRDVSFSSAGGAFATADEFDGSRGEMAGVLVSVFGDGGPASELSARSAAWDPAAREWVFRDGTLVRYGGRDEKPETAEFAEYRSAEPGPPGDLVLGRLVPDGVSARGVLERIRRLRAAGSPVVSETVLFYAKLAGPLSGVVLAALGVTLVLLVRMGRLLSFGAALAAGFLFWTAMIMAQSAGEAELLPPLAAGFGPALLFLALALLGLRRARVF